MPAVPKFQSQLFNAISLRDVQVLCQIAEQAMSDVFQNLARQRCRGSEPFAPPGILEHMALLGYGVVEGKQREGGFVEKRRTNMLSAL